MRLLLITLMIVFSSTDLHKSYASDAAKSSKHNCNLQVAFEYSVDELKVNFTNQSQGSFDYVEWNFGDENISNDQSPTHIYETGGVYNFCVLISSSTCNCNDEFCGKVYVFDPCD